MVYHVKVLPLILHHTSQEILSQQHPYEPIYQDPVYNNVDADDDGVPDNPGQILYYVPTRTGQKNNTNVSVGMSATWSRPLDKEQIELCKNAAALHNEYRAQLTANKRLDFEIARLKNCGELMKGWYSIPSKVSLSCCMC